MFVGWDNVWNVFVGTKQFTPQSVTPNGGWVEPYVTTLFTAVYEDSAGADDIRYADLIFNVTPDPTACVAVRYDVQNDLMYLHEPGKPTKWRPADGTAPAAGGAIRHNYGKIYVSQSSVTKWQYPDHHLGAQAQLAHERQAQNLYMTMTDIRTSAMAGTIMAT